MSSLYISNCLDLYSDNSFVLHRLEELCLHNVSPDDQHQCLFSPSAFPALRVFSYTYDASHLYDIGSLLLRLEPQLDLLWIDAGFLGNLESAELDRINKKTLFDCALEQIRTLPNVQSYRITHPSYDNRFSTTLRELAKIIRASTTPLPSVLYLAVKESVDPSLEDWRQDLRDLGRERNMEVVFEPAHDWNVDRGRPTEFYRRMKGGTGKGIMRLGRE